MLAKLANFRLIVLRAGIVAISEPTVVTISARNTIMRKLCKLGKAIFSTHYNIFQPNFGILLPSKGSFWEFRFYCQDQNLVYNTNCPLKPSLVRID